MTPDTTEHQTELVTRGGVPAISVNAMPSAATPAKRRVAKGHASHSPGLAPRFEIRRQYGPSADHRPRVEWRIQAGHMFIAYSRTWSGARKAAIEIEASLARVFGEPTEDRRRKTGVEQQGLTQQAIDRWEGAQRPMGNLRRLFWNAAAKA
jgi:hypothetical protein